MSDYKATLNLPQTDFPMKANLAQREPERLKAWAEMDLYGQMREAGQEVIVPCRCNNIADCHNLIPLK